MSRLTMQLKSSIAGRVDLQHTVPDRWLGLGLPEILSWPISVDGQATTIADCFDVVDGQRDQWVLRGDLERCDHVAGGMRGGELVLESSIGDYLAADMRGGTVVVRGDAGAYAASSLRGGHVSIFGNVGRYAAAAAPGASRGMSGGTLVVHGNAEQWLATRMRRGLVVVHGSIAAGCASRMLAGTVVACGAVELPLGCGMSRGTLLLINPSSQLVAGGCSGFTEPTPCELSFLPLLMNSLFPELPAGLAPSLAGSRWVRCLGDRAELGLGELFLREANDNAPAGDVNPS